MSRKKDILVIVGPRSFADVRALTVMRDVMQTYLQDNEPDVIWSGGADGGDMWAEALALEWSIDFMAILPQMHRWGGDGGFRDRDRHMAQNCTRLLGFACRWPASGGAIWTANQAEQLGKPVERYTVPGQVRNGKIQTWGPDGKLARLLVTEGVVTDLAQDAPPYAAAWVGQHVDVLLSRLRREKARVRWTGFV